MIERPISDEGHLPTALRLIELADEHIRLFGEEEMDLDDWLGEDVASNPVELAEVLEEIEGLAGLVRRLKAVTGQRLQELLSGGAVRVGDVVYVEGAGSGTWKATREFWQWFSEVIHDESDTRATALALDQIVSGVRVTAIDEVANTHQLDKRAVRDTFLDYRPGRPGLQRKDLSVENVAKTARKWWPTDDRTVVYPNREEN